MVRLAGIEYTRQELLRRVGSLAQIGGVEATVLNDGLARGTRALHFSSTSGLRATILPDRAMDLAQLTWKGSALSWFSKNGLTSPGVYQRDSQGFLRSFFGGMLTTCGLTNIGPACVDDQDEFPMHGRLPGLPASNVAWGESWNGDACTLWASGEVHEARIFGENLTLIREVRMSLDGTSISVHDQVRNDGFSDTPHMILYHSNAGFPLLSEHSRLFGTFASVVPRDDAARAGLADFDHYTEPQHGFAEQVYIATPQPDADGWNEVVLWNPLLDGGLGLKIRWQAATLPWLIIWKMLGEGTYVLGMEPANCPTIEGRAEARSRGTLPVLKAGETRSYQLEYSIVTGSPAGV